MPLLTKFVYGLQTDSKKTPFGLLNNQVKIDNIIQSAGWFNIKGERLGCGDLTLKDMAYISKHISPEEVFIAVGEANCEWNLPSGLDRTAPGFEYIISKAVWVMAKANIGGIVLRVRDDIEKQEEAEKDGIKYLRIPRADLYKAMTQPPPPPKKAPEADSDDGLKEKRAAALAKAKAILSAQQKQLASQVAPTTPAAPTQQTTTAKQSPLKKTTTKLPSSNMLKPVKKTSKGYLTP